MNPVNMKNIGNIDDLHHETNSCTAQVKFDTFKGISISSQKYKSMTTT